MQRRNLLPYAVALGLMWGVPVNLVILLHLVLPDHNASGQCTGIGFGCTLPPAEGVVLLGYLAALPLIVLGLVACVVIAVVQSRRRLRAPGGSAD